MCKKLISLLTFVLVLGLVLTNVARSDEPGWPINCVKLAKGQVITVDGTVTAAEYTGAQAVVINQQTASSPDPWTPGWIHEMTLAGAATWGTTPLEDCNNTYYVMWDDENFYIACSAQDDDYYNLAGNPNGNDSLQFTITETPFENDSAYMYIPTIAPKKDGKPHVRNDFGGYIQHNIFQHPEVEVAGSVDTATQDWMVELKIPWRILTGDFRGDLAQGDQDGDGKNTFPPAVGDTIGFNIIVLDYDVEGTGATRLLLAGTHPGGHPWQGIGAKPQETLTFVGKPVGLGLASNPNPANSATDVPSDVVLNWTPGEFADQHDVYFGTNFDDVNDATNLNPMGPDQVYRTRQGADSYAAGEALDFGQTYYWRVDEVNAPPTSHVVFKGDVWSFTVEPIGYPIAGDNITATASSSFDASTGPENTVNGSGLDADDLHSIKQADIWLTSTTGQPPIWIQYEFDKAYKLHEMWVWNFNQVFEPTVGFGLKDVTIEYSANGTDWAQLAGVPEFARAPGTADYAHSTTVDFGGAAAKYVKLIANDNWGVMTQYGLSEVRFFYIPVCARQPNPYSGATNVGLDVSLGWRAGREAAQHDVYLSTNEQAVIDETISPVSVPADSSYASYDTGAIDLAQRYYWKVNEVNEAETPTTWESDVWNFATHESLVVDDFELYNDLEPTDPKSNRIFVTWVDGFEVPTNGSLVGYDSPPFCEQTIVHEGKQSMPFFYDNSTVSYSEATANIANLPVGPDWAKSGIKTLSLWFYGDPNNAAEQMYVKVNGSKVAYDGDADNLARMPWQMWNINLADFGTNLSNVTELSIGFERSGAVGGAGLVLFDDISLTPFDRQLITPVDPGTTGLEAHYEFEGTTNDSSVNARHGTAMGGPAFVAGKVGQAISFDGVDDYVEITGYKGVMGPNPFSITAWINTSDIEGTIMGWGSTAGGTTRVEFRINDDRLRCESSGNVQGDTTLPNNKWIHVAVTVKAGAVIDDPDVTLYLDGQDDTRTSTGSANPLEMAAGYDVTIGRRHSGASRWFVGLIDDVRLYDRVLTPEEIAFLAGKTKPYDKPF